MEEIIDLHRAPLSDIIASAWDRRSQFNLEGVGYGRSHWGDFTEIVQTPAPYYFFLAAMAWLTSSRRIVEVGTHDGGSARALCAGFRDRSNSRLVTFDVTDNGAKLLADHSVIRAFTMDGNSEAAFDVCIREFGDPNVDLVYIDAEHRFWPTLLSFLVYGLSLSANFVIIDDIKLNTEMQNFWNLVQNKFGENAVDASSVIGDIRPASPHDPPSGPGFGLVRTALRQ